eukprot:CAMPEP_0197634382 /NCGR_PEP_ID=MMETSP1338-20131121/10495_1 /TAXON_ID=43686 ORGANISM="Pelagodinium beii, Strain RCC1491" /NCGR_SAMPLE_ID=MMETSP1338 /ASSEMBLY_ACC=CAM_ASM_000754 /LENGTH=147 /DNA_ID=CAMNT_0043206237 /DNA_START=161 /DNA_END=601 /DNA_ORIENTATION=+
MVISETDTFHASFSNKVLCRRSCGWSGRVVDIGRHWYDCPFASMHEFEIAVELVADNKLGLGFSCSPDFPRYLCVSAIQEEVWRRNTKSGYGERRLSVGDALVEINGSRGSSIALLRLVELILKSPDRENLRLVFQHPRLFQFSVAK